MEGEKGMLIVKSPAIVYLDITYSCNWNCQFCNLKYPSEMLPLKVFQRILTELKNAEVFEVTLFGGEPLLHPDFFRIAEEIYKTGFYINFVSNGMLISKENINLIKQFFKEASISLHGFEDTHDKLAGIKGAFKKVIKSLDLLSENGLTTEICVTITAINLDEIPQLMKFLLEHYSSFYISLTLFEPLQGYRMDLVPEYNKLKSVLKEISEIRKTYPNVYVEPSGACPFCLFPDLELVKKSCWAGILQGAIDPYGNVKVCSLSRVPVGNIFLHPLTEIWQNSPTIKWFRSLKWITEPCNNCPLLSKCLGGCKVAGSEPFSPDMLVKIWKDYIKLPEKDDYESEPSCCSESSMILGDASLMLDERVKLRKDLAGILVRNPYEDYFLLPEETTVLLDYLKHPRKKNEIIKEFSDFETEELEDFLAKLYHLGIIKTVSGREKIMVKKEEKKGDTIKRLKVFKLTPAGPAEISGAEAMEYFNEIETS